MFIGSLKAGFVTERSELGSCIAFRFQYPILIGICTQCESVTRGYGDHSPLTTDAALERRRRSAEGGAAAAHRGRSPYGAPPRGAPYIVYWNSLCPYTLHPTRPHSVVCLRRVLGGGERLIKNLRFVAAASLLDPASCSIFEVAPLARASHVFDCK